ncbi:MAG TPA: hypothetical protein VFV99_09820 [Kofleriaceae bacterium]|nr:hypothetical protein [Kofleriaceae bacterium]
METRTLQRSTEYYGLGQSGYTAGRVEGDVALELELEGRNTSYPKGVDEEHVLELGDDERYWGAGGRPWIPPETEARKE